MKKITTTVSEETYKKIQEIKKEHNIPYNALIMLGIKAFIKQNKD